MEPQPLWACAGRELPLLLDAVLSFGSLPALPFPMRKFKGIEPTVPGTDPGVGHTAMNHRRGACPHEAVWWQGGHSVTKWVNTVQHAHSRWARKREQQLTSSQSTRDEVFPVLLPPNLSLWCQGYGRAKDTRQLTRTGRINHLTGFEVGKMGNKKFV